MDLLNILDGIAFVIETTRPVTRGGVQFVQVGLQASIIPPTIPLHRAYAMIADRARELLEETVRQYTVLAPIMMDVKFYVEGRSDADHAIVANHNQVVPFRQIDAGLFEGLFGNVLQSQENIQLNSIMWYFTVNPNDLYAGGSEKVSRPSYIRKRWMYPSWTGHEEVGCAAYAIALEMHHRKDRNTRPSTIVNKAIALQEKLGWEKILTPNRVLEFVDHPDYKDYAIGILFSHLVRNPISSNFYREGPDYDFESDWENGFQKRIYIHLDTRQNHYGCVDKLALANPTKASSNDYSYQHWCHHCHCAFMPYQRSAHLHGLQPPEKKQKTDDTPVEKTCYRCRQVYLSSTKHLCPTYECKICKAFQERGKTKGHRCPLLPSDFAMPKKSNEMVEEEADEDNDELIEFVTNESQLNQGYFCLFAYDFESCIDVKKRNSRQIVGFEMDENGQYKKDDNGNPVLQYVNGCDYTFDYSHHRVNLICYKNVFLPDETKVIPDFSPTDTKQGLLEFINFALSYNEGNNLFYAHNASGYDSRLLFQALKELHLNVSICPVTRGGKFIQITVKRWVTLENGKRKLMKTIFRDSMLHLGGGIKALGADFCQDVGLEKGHFPHLFNRPENFGYKGPLPPLDSFDFTFSAKSQKELDEAVAWWNERKDQGEWDFEKEIVKYCINDVDMLAEIMKKFHDITVDWFKYSPWYELLI